MIDTKSERINSGYLTDPIVARRTVKDALELLVVHEVGFGGCITVIEPRKVQVKTTVLNCLDTMTFEGAEDEMELLVEAAALAVETQPQKHAKLWDSCIDQVMTITKGNPLMVKLGSGQIIGATNARFLCWAMLLREPDQLPFFEKLSKLSVQDLLALVMLVRYDDVPLEDAMTLAA